MNRLFLALLLIALPLTAYSQEEFIPAIGDAVVTASIGEPTTLVPILASDSASADICGLVFNGLVKYGPDLQLTGDLAESWEVRQDGLEILFHLRKNVRWQDGAPFTARDVRFTYERLVDPQVATPYSGDFERISQLEVMDDHTVRILYKEPFVPGVSSWGMWIMPQHLLAGKDLATTDFREKPVGTGPYRLKRWVRGDRLELEANPDYFEGRPFVSGYIYRIVPDQGTIFLELQTEGVDLAGLTALQYERMTDAPRFRRSFEKFRYPSFGYTYLGYNLQDARFQDLRVRRAISLAIDRGEIIRGVLLGLGQEATGPYPKESWAHNSNVQPAVFDPAQAKALLKESGWKDTDGDGVLDRGGEPFEFTLLTNQGNQARELTAQIVQRRLADVGIRVKIWVLEWSSLLHEFIDKKRFEAVLLGWSLSRDPDLFDIFHSSKTKPGEFNFIGYSNPQADRLLLAGRMTFEPQQRRRIYQSLHALFAADQPCCFLYVSDSLPAVHRRFREVEATPIGIGHNQIHWYVPADEQRYEVDG